MVMVLVLTMDDDDNGGGSTNCDGEERGHVLIARNQLNR